ncbi:MAG: signal peptidase II [Pseudobdellovibrionaceae bacterium]|jgi:signal peptidase II
MKKKYLWLLVIAGIIISLDQLTKILIISHFQLSESLVVIPDFFNITYVRNFGAAFGILTDSHPDFREVFFLTMPPMAVLLILWLLRSVEDNDLIQVIGLSLIFSGAIGNYIDRLRFRYVIDFLDFHLANKYTWPAFNVADAAIVGGVGLMFLAMFLEKKRLSAAQTK